MYFINLWFVVFLIGLLIVYYVLPVKLRPAALLCGSLAFYAVVCPEGMGLLLLTAIAAWDGGRRIRGVSGRKKKWMLSGYLLLVSAPWLCLKGLPYYVDKLFEVPVNPLLVPLGISFYTLQLISYLVDIYREKIEPESNWIRFLLYATYFPQIIQGPIPRFEELGASLKEEKRFHETVFVKGFQLILWGWFLKLMIADKAGILVDTVFAKPETYPGAYVLLAGCFYSVQLYADFLSCVCIARGMSELFGISLTNNFDHPYFSRSIGEFWRRWHISLSRWLRDYVYIPLGGNRKGRVCKYRNLMLTFLVSGFWHGSGVKYLFWGLLQGSYQVAGSVTQPLRERIRLFLHVDKEDKLLKLWQQAATFFLLVLSWIIFRAANLKTGLQMLLSLFTVYNPWIFFDDSILKLGLSWKELVVLGCSVGVLIWVGRMQEKCSIRDKIMQQGIVTRWLIYLTVILVILVFGTYGYGYNAKDFIYGGF